MTFGRHYRRILVLHYYQSSLGCKKLAQLTVPPVSYSTVRRIIRRFRRYGDYDTPANSRRRRAGLIPSDRVDWLVAFLKERDCTLYLDEMVEQLRDQVKRWMVDYDKDKDNMLSLDERAPLPQPLTRLCTYDC